MPVQDRPTIPAKGAGNTTPRAERPEETAAAFDLVPLLEGDGRAWDIFVETYGPGIQAVARRTLERAGLASDHVAEVTQNVFLRLCKDGFRLLRTYDPERAALSTWLRVVTSSGAIDYLRRQRPATPLDDVPERELAQPPAEPVPLNIPEDLLTARQRLVLRLTYDKDMDVSDVARLLGVNPQTVRSTRHKALIRLRAWVKEEED